MISRPTSIRDFNYWHGSIIIAIFGGFIFLRPFLGTIALAALAAFIFNPVYKALMRRSHNRTGLSISLTVLFSFLAIGIPLALLLVITAAQAHTLINNVQSSQALNGASVADIAGKAVQAINDIAEPVANNDQLIKVADIQSFINEKLPELGQAALRLVTGFVGGIPQFFTLLILYLFVFIAFLQKQAGIIKRLKAISPFDEKTNNMYIQRIGSMTKAMVKGQLVIALVQGLIGAASLAVIGFEEYFFFLVMVLTVLSFIPLGGGILVIPIGLVLLVTGNIWQGLLVLGTHFLITSNIDNILRAKLVPKDAHLPAALILLAAFAGVFHFGFLGVIYGPIIMIVLVTTIETYIQSVGQN